MNAARWALLAIAAIAPLAAAQTPQNPEAVDSRVLLGEIKAASAAQPPAPGRPARPSPARPFLARYNSFLGLANVQCTGWARKTYAALAIADNPLQEQCGEVSAAATYDTKFDPSILAMVTDTQLIVTCRPRPAAEAARLRARRLCAEHRRKARQDLGCQRGESDLQSRPAEPTLFMDATSLVCQPLLPPL